MKKKLTVILVLAAVVLCMVFSACSLFGGKNSCRHDYTWFPVNDTTHKGICDLCQDKKTESHKIVNGVCTVCGYENNLPDQQKYQITCNLRGGHTQNSQDFEIIADLDYNSTPTIAITPERDGYVFCGWSKSAETENLWVNAQDTVTGNITLYAVWEEDSAEICSFTGAEQEEDGFFLFATPDIYAIDLANTISCREQNTLKLFDNKDRPCTDLSTGYLQNGNNNFTIKVSSSRGTFTTTYTLTVFKSYNITISYYGHENTYLDNETTLAGREFTPSYAPTFPGYEFLGWLLDGEPYQPTKLYESQALTVSLKAKTFTVSYEKSDLSPTTVTYGSAFTLPVPTLDTYTFEGWYLDSVQITDNQGSSLDVWQEVQNTTVSAHWVPNSYTLTVTSNGDGGSVTGGGEYPHGSEVHLSATTNSGYTFLGWFCDGESLGTEARPTVTMPAKECEIVARWIEMPLTVTKTQGGNVTGDIPEKTVVGQQISFEAHTDVGYTFLGWFDGETCLGTELNATFPMPSSATTYTAKWIPIPLALQCNVDDAGRLSALPARSIVGQEVTVVATTNNGYTFAGWYLGETKLSADPSYTLQMPTEPTTLCAKWIRVAFTTDGSRGGYLDPPKGVFLSGQEVTATAITFDGYVFAGWYSNEQKLGSELELKYTMPEHDATIVAKWAKVTLTSNNGEAGEISSLNGKYLADENVTISATVYLGYRFDGWYVGTQCLSTDSQFTISMPNVNTDFVAQFSKMPELVPFTVLSTVDSCIVTGITDKSAREIVVPDVVTGIREGAFNGCGRVQSITLPFVGNNDTFPFGYVFGTLTYNGGTLATQTYLLNNGERTYQAYLPATLKNVTITGSSLPLGAFSGCEQIETVQIGAGLTQIPNKAFLGCKSLRQAPLQSTVQSIGMSAFKDCYRLTLLTLPQNVTAIELYAFEGCTNLVEIHNLSQLTVVPGSMDNGQVAYYAGNVYTDDVGTSKVTVVDGFVFYCDGTTCQLINYVGEATDLVLPNDVEGNAYEIKPKALCNLSEIQSVVVPDTVTKIGLGALSGCSGLRSLTIPYLGNVADPTGLAYPFGYVFGTDSYRHGVAVEQTYRNVQGYSNTTTTYYLPAGLHSVTLLGNLYYGAFSNCYTLQNVTIGEDITQIPGYAFSGCLQLADINLSPNLSSIGERAFAQCKLGALTLPDTLLTIGEGAFSGAARLASVTFGAGLTAISAQAFSGCTALTRIDLPNTVVSVGEKAFFGCANVTLVSLGAKFATLGNKAFADCTKLETFTVDSANTQFIAVGGVLFSKDGTALRLYAAGNRATEYVVPANVTVIRDSAFAGNGFLRSITLSAGLMEIKANAFANCTALRTVNFNNGLRIVGDKAFDGCTALTSVALPASVTSMGEAVFVRCSALVEMVLPFVGNGGSTTVLGYIFGKESYTGCTSVRQGDSYAVDSYYYLPSTIRRITVLGGEIGNRAFCDCKMLTAVTMPSNITYIGSYAFYGCTGLTAIVIPNTVKTIRSNAFDGCTSLNNVAIPASVTTIGAFAFSNCRALTYATIGNYSGWKITQGNTTQDLTLSHGVLAQYLRATYSTYTWTHA